MTNTEILELIKCKDDINYFVTFLDIPISDEQRTQLVNIKRSKYVAHNTDNDVDLTVTSIYLLWKLYFSKREFIALLGTIKNTKDVFNNIKLIYNTLPEQYKHADFNFSYSRIKFGDSVIYSGSVKKYSVVGKHLDCIFLLCDKHTDIKSIFEYSIPCMASSTTGQFIISGADSNDTIMKYLSESENKFRFIN